MTIKNRQLNPMEVGIYQKQLKAVEFELKDLNIMAKQRTFYIEEYLQMQCNQQIAEYKRSLKEIQTAINIAESKIDTFNNHLTNGVPPVKKEGEK